MNSLFKLTSEISDLPSINEGKIKPIYEEVSCQKNVTGDQFSAGQQSYKWSCSSGKWWIPRKSHFVLDMTLSNIAKDGPINKNNIGAAMGLVSNLFQSCELRIGGKTVQRTTQFLPQVDALIHRASKSKPWLDSVGEAQNFWNNDFAVRIGEVHSSIGLGGRRCFKFQLIWAPPLMLFHAHQGGMPSGDYEVVLVPATKTQYKLGVIEHSGLTVPQPSVDYEFAVDKLRLLVATISGPRSDDLSYALSLDHIECQSAKIQSDSLSQQYFTISPATKALAIAYQDTRVTENKVNASRFSVANTNVLPNDPKSNLANGLSRLYVQYAGVTKPSPDALPEYKSLETDRTTERYRETMDSTGMSENPAGMETLQDWQTRGPYYYFDWERDSRDGSTRVQVNQEFLGLDSAGTPNSTNMNILLFSISTTSAQITIRNGAVVEVVQVER